MQKEIIAVIFQEGGRLISQILRLRVPRIKGLEEIHAKQPEPVPPLDSPMEYPRPTVYQTRNTAATEQPQEDKVKKGTACLPCTNSHLITCVGLLNEAYRMSPQELTPDSGERVDKCLAEIAANERVDLAPENIATLPPEEKNIALHALAEIREIRHGLEGLESKGDLEILATRTANLQKYIGAEWFKMRLAKMPKAEKVKIAEKAIERLEKEF